jgi:OOP family OmpA-OmpF porin
MKNARAFQLLALGTLGGLGTLLATSALAQDAAYSYGGLSVGRATANINEEGITARQLGGMARPPVVSSITRDDKDTAYRLFLGYQFNRNIGLEASYFHLGSTGFQANTTPAGQLNGRLAVQGGGLDLVGTLPLGEQFAFLARVGGQYAKTRDHFTGTGAVVVSNPNPSSRQFNYKAGVGLQYAFNPNFLMRLEAEQYKVRDAMDGHERIRVYSLSAVFPFGAGATRTVAAPEYRPVAYTAPPPPVAAPAPMPPMVMTPVAPAPAPMPAPVTLRRVSFSAESLFGFDQSALRPEGKAALDTFARELAGTRFEVIVVEGHADRIGSATYNQKLSLQRADAVKAYLQPDRRVDVEVKGTRQ